MDIGDRTSRYWVLDEDGTVLREAVVATTREGMTRVLASMGRCRIALEVGGHSPWLSRLLASFGHEAIVANPRQVKLITQSTRKNDRLDGHILAQDAGAGSAPHSPTASFRRGGAGLSCKGRIQFETEMARH